MGLAAVLSACAVFVSLAAALSYWIAFLGADWPPGSGRNE